MGIVKTATQYLPSVAFLMGRHGLTQESIQAIQGTGPKNRILKGDILAFIKGGVSKDYVDLVKKEQFYTMQINLKKANQVIKSGLTINDIIATGVFRASKSLGLTTTVGQLTREAHVGTLKKQIDLTTTKPTKSVLKPGSISLIDSLALGARFETPTYHLSNGEAVIVSVNPLVQDSTEEDIIDILAGSSVNVTLKKSFSNELLDQTPQIQDVQLDLTIADSIPHKKVTDFVAMLKNLIESEPETLK